MPAHLLLLQDKLSFVRGDLAQEAPPPAFISTGQWGMGRLATRPVMIWMIWMMMTWGTGDAACCSAGCSRGAKLYLPWQQQVQQQEEG